MARTNLGAFFVFLLGSAAAGAAPLGPGDGAVLSGADPGPRTLLDGPVSLDLELVDGGPLINATVESTVWRLADDRLVFQYVVANGAGSALAIDRVGFFDYEGREVEAEFLPTGPGTVPPFNASRASNSDGFAVSFFYSSVTPITPGATGRTLYLVTNAAAWDANGFVRIGNGSTNGDFLGVLRPVPEPGAPAAGAAVLLALGAFEARRRAAGPRTPGSGRDGTHAGGRSTQGRARADRSRRSPRRSRPR